MERFFLGFDSLLKRKVAVKIINLNAVESFVIEAVDREIQVMVALHGHKNIITLFDMFEEDNMLFLVMEYIPLSLVDYLQKKKFLKEKTSKVSLSTNITSGKSYAQTPHRPWGH